DSFFPRADEYVEQVRVEVEAWLRNRIAAWSLPEWLVEQYGSQRLIEASWEEGSFRFKVAPTAALVISMLVGCAAPNQPSYRQETSTVLKRTEKTAVAHLGDDNHGYVIPPQFHYGRIAEIDHAIERWQNGEIETNEVVETITSALDELSQRPDEDDLLYAVSIYMQERHAQSITRLSQEA